MLAYLKYDILVTWCWNKCFKATLHSWCNIGPDRSRQNYQLFSFRYLFVDHGTTFQWYFFLAQCWPSQIKRRFLQVVFSRIDDCVLWANFSLVTVLCNVVLDIFTQHRLGDLSMQWWQLLGQHCTWFFFCNVALTLKGNTR